MILVFSSAPKWLDSQRSTEIRQSTLADYCQSLVNLPHKISHSELVRLFFKVRPEDENPPAPTQVKRNETFVMSKDKSRGTTSEISGPIILDSYRVLADYKKTSKHEIDLTCGDYVDIVEKSSNGWWFCQCEARHGWVPAAYLEPLDAPEESEEPEPDYEGEIYITTRTYTAVVDDELTLESGETVEVIHKLLDGWWVVRKGEETGHFPSMFLHATGEKIDTFELNKTQRQTPPPRRSSISNAKSIHNRTSRRLSQDTYRRNSRRVIQQRGSRPRKSSMPPVGSPLQERKNQDNISEPASSSVQDTGKKSPTVPPRPSAELIMERCTENTRMRVSLRKSSAESN